MKKKMLMAVLLGAACLSVGCSSKNAEKTTEAVTEANVSSENETKTGAADETEAVSEEAEETETEEASEAPAENGTESISEEAEEVTEEELGERPDYTALDYVTLGTYTGLAVTVDPIEVTEDEITDSIQGEVQAQDLYEEQTEGTVKEGDIANIDYEGKLDGVAFDGGTAEGYDLTIGSGTFIDGFEDGLIGVKVGDTVDLNLTFPENYQSEELAGQETVFTVTVNSIKTMPEITDELVNTLSEGAYSTVDGYREYMKEQLIQDKEEEQQNTILSDLMTQVYNTCTVNDYPQELVDYSLTSMTNTYKSYAEMYGMEFGDFVQAYFGMTEDEFSEQALEAVKQSLQQELILKAIAEQEEITVSEEEYASGSANYAEELGYESAEALQEEYGRATIEISLLIDKVLDFVEENAIIRENLETEMESEAGPEPIDGTAEPETSSEQDTEAVSEESSETETEADSEAETEK